MQYKCQIGQKIPYVKSAISTQNNCKLIADYEIRQKIMHIKKKWHLKGVCMSPDRVPKVVEIGIGQVQSPKNVISENMSTLR